MWWLLTAALAGESCEHVGMAQVVNHPTPAIIVLGERHGMQPDLSRAWKVAQRLTGLGPVTIALEAVHSRYQPVLDDFASGRFEEGTLPGLLEWDTSWGFPWRPYASLVTASQEGMHVVAAGLDLGPRPDDQSVPLPPSYMDILRPAMAGHPVPPGDEGSFILAMAWRDFRIADLAVKAWDGRGYLVIVTGRGHVEGGKGVAWQATRMSTAPVHAYVLVAGQEPPCYPGDKLWR